LEALAGSDWAKAAGSMAMNLVSSSASKLFGSAVGGFRGEHNSDVEKSMQKAALEALDRLSGDAPAGFDSWFDAWRRYLISAPVKEVFAGVPDLDPVALSYDDDRFRDLWWSRMEPVLAAWSLRVTGTLPGPLSAFLRERLPEALQRAHQDVLRNPEMNRSWIGFQQHVYEETLNHLLAIREDLGEIKEILKGRVAAQNVWNIPLPTNHFQDRPDLIDQIDRALKQGATALTALHGLGGIGKTQLARRFAQQRREQYKLGAWIEAETTVSLLTNLSGLAPLLGVSVEQDQQAMASRVMNELSAREPWLVIFDNAASAETLRPYVEMLSGNGHVLITSRNEEWGDLAATVSVTQWSVAESAHFLLERTGQNDRRQAEALARDLDGLVLALEHAAAYMLAGDGMTLAEYRRVWREKLKWVAKGHAYPDSVAAALALSIDAVARESGAAYDLLCVFAWLAPDRIPRKALLEAGASKLPEALATAFEDRDAWAEVTDTLGRYSLLKRERADGVVGAYYLHRVVQKVVQDRQEGAEGMKVACDLVSAAFPFESWDPHAWPTSEELLPHARAIRESVRGRDSPASLGIVLNQASLYLRERGLYFEARDFLALALESDLRNLGPDHPEVAIHRSNLAQILGDLGEHAEARKQIEVALESDLQQLGPDHRNVAVDRSTLANVLLDLGEHEEARRQFELALDSDLRQFGPDRPEVAVDRSNLANILRRFGELEEARKQMEIALESDLRQSGPDHPNVARRRSNLALILNDLGEYAEALKQVELALELDLRQLGAEHPTVAIRRMNLASILCNLDAGEAALREIDQALEIFRKKLPPEHPNIREAERRRKTILGVQN